MLEIERLSWRTPRYAVRDDRGLSGTWVRRRGRETMAGDLDGQPYEFGRDGRRHFFLTHGGAVVATADAERRGQWRVSVGDAVYALRRKSVWRSEMELSRGGAALGSIRRGRSRRIKVRCALPSELSPEAQTFIGLVVLMLWNRAEASSGAAATGAAVASS